MDERELDAGMLEVSRLLCSWKSETHKRPKYVFARLVSHAMTNNKEQCLNESLSLKLSPPVDVFILAVGHGWRSSYGSFARGGERPKWRLHSAQGAWSHHGVSMAKGTPGAVI